MVNCMGPKLSGRNFYANLNLLAPWDLSGAGFFVGAGTWFQKKSEKLQQTIPFGKTHTQICFHVQY